MTSGAHQYGFLQCLIERTDHVHAPHTNDWIDKKHNLEMTPTNSRKIDLFGKYGDVPIQIVTLLGQEEGRVSASEASIILDTDKEIRHRNKANSTYSLKTDVERVKVNIFLAAT